MKFGLIGDGFAAQRHKQAIAHIGGTLAWIKDPFSIKKTIWQGDSPVIYKNESPRTILNKLPVDYVIIASPNYLHYQQTKEILSCENYLGRKTQIICEKPLCMPWEPIIDDDRINICLQLRYIPILPERAEFVKAVMVRGEEFWKSWKGDPRLAGGNLYEFFIHYIDLAILLHADFEGAVKPEAPGNKQDRYIATEDGLINIMGFDMQALYNKMYEEILAGRGVKPKDIFYLKWVLDHYSKSQGFRISGVDKPIRIPRSLL